MTPVHHRRIRGCTHLLDRGHFLLESQLDTAVAYIRGFLGRTLS